MFFLKKSFVPPPVTSEHYGFCDFLLQFNLNWFILTVTVCFVGFRSHGCNEKMGVLNVVVLLRRQSFWSELYAVEMGDPVLCTLVLVRDISISLSGP